MRNLILLKYYFLDFSFRSLGSYIFIIFIKSDFIFIFIFIIFNFGGIFILVQFSFLIKFRLEDKISKKYRRIVSIDVLVFKVSVSCFKDFIIGNIL